MELEIIQDYWNIAVQKPCLSQTQPDGMAKVINTDTKIEER